jgi:hypothetical protein
MTESPVETKVSTEAGAQDEGDTNMTRLAIMAALSMGLAAGLAGCNRGSGEVKSETRQASAFSRIDVTAGIGVTVRIGSAQTLEVRAQENILPLIATDVQGATLRIHSTQGYTTSEGVHVTIVTPALAGISMSGGSQGQIAGIAADDLEIELSGGSGLTASGTARTVTAKASGGSRGTLSDLSATTVTVVMTGGSTAIVRASEEVRGSASGGSRVTVVGAAKLNVQASGGSDVRRE